MTPTPAVLLAAPRPIMAAAPASAADTTCVPQNATIPAGANTTDPQAPFFIDTTGIRSSPSVSRS